MDKKVIGPISVFGVIFLGIIGVGAYTIYSQTKIMSEYKEKLRIINEKLEKGEITTEEAVKLKILADPTHGLAYYGRPYYGRPYV